MRLDGKVAGAARRFGSALIEGYVTEGASAQVTAAEADQVADGGCATQ